MTEERLRFVFHNAVAMAGTAGLMFFSYLYHIVMARSLPPAVYGDLSLLIGAVSVLVIPSNSLQTIVAREVALLRGKGATGSALGVVSGALRASLAYGGGAGLLLAALSLLAALATGIQLFYYFVLIALFVPIWYGLAVARGFLQGTERVVVLSTVLAAEPLLKVALAVAFVALGWGLLGALVPVELASLLLLLPFIPLLLRVKPIKLTANASLLWVAAAMLLITGFFYADLYAIRLYQGAVNAGVYNVAAITARILYFIASGLVLVFLPRSSLLSYSNPSQILGLLGKTVVFLLPPAALFLLAPNQFIVLFYSATYAAAAGPFFILSGGMLLFSIAFILMNLAWSQKDELAPLVIAAISLLAQIALLAVLVPSGGLNGAALATTAASALMLAMAGGYTAYRVAGGRPLLKPGSENRLVGVAKRG